MSTIPFRCALVAIVVFHSICATFAQQDSASKTPAAMPEVEKLDPFKRPEGSITDQSARFYLWYDDDGWHLRTTAKSPKVFTGTIRVKDATIKSCVSIGLKTDKGKSAADVWAVNDKRDELRLQFTTGKLSDGFDLAIKGDDGQIEFDLKAENKSDPKAIFIGHDRKHPSKVPFSFPSKPKPADEKKPK